MAKIDGSNEQASTLQARIVDLSKSDPGNFDAYLAYNLIEEAIGGALTREITRAPMIDFTNEEVDALEKIVRLFDRHHPEMKDEADLEMYTELVRQAESDIDIVREKRGLAKKAARIPSNLFVADLFNNTLNAEADIYRRRKRSGAA